MEYFWWLYLATRLDDIKKLFIGFTLLGVMGTIATIFITFICLAESVSDDTFKMIKWWRRALITLAVMGTIGQALTPSRKDAMFIAGGVGVIEAAKAVAGSEIAKKSVAVIEQWLTNNLKELEQEGEKSNGRKK